MQAAVKPRQQSLIPAPAAPPLPELPEWAVAPRGACGSLEVRKEGEVIDNIQLNRARILFGRGANCDVVLEHPSISRHHAALLHHHNGSIFVVDLGSAHGTFISGERIPKEVPSELEDGCSLRFAVSSRVYILRLPPIAPSVRTARKSEDIPVPPVPDPNDADAVLVYNTICNQKGLYVEHVHLPQKADTEEGEDIRKAKKPRTSKVMFRDETGGKLEDVVGISLGDGFAQGVGPAGVEKGNGVGKFEGLVTSTIVPRKDKSLLGASTSPKSSNSSAITQRLQLYLQQSLRSPTSEVSLYGDLPPVSTPISKDSPKAEDTPRGACDTGDQASKFDKEAGNPTSLRDNSVSDNDSAKTLVHDLFAESPPQEVDLHKEPDANGQTAAL
eukprot:jgi/Chlat1/7744/Chrsp66S07325